MSENSNGRGKAEMPNSEVVAKAQRKRFTVAEKLRLLREVEGLPRVGSNRRLVWREGVYSSYLTTRRKQRELGELDGLSPHQPGQSLSGLPL